MALQNAFENLSTEAKQDDLLDALAELGFLTNVELRDSPLQVVDQGVIDALADLSFPTNGLTDAQLRATPVPVSGPLTDTQLRATPVPVSGTVAITGGQTDALTDAQLRASAVPVSDGGGSITVDFASPPVVNTALGKVEDVAHVSGDIGVMALAVRNDAGGALATTTGDYIPLTTDSAGLLRIVGPVTVQSQIPGTGATNLGKAEDAAHTTGDTGVMSLAVRNDTASALTDANGDYSPVAVDAAGRQIVTFVAGAAQIAKTEDTAHASGDVGVFMLGVRNTAFSALTDNSGDYSPIAVDTFGRVMVAATVLEPGTGATSLAKAEDAAHTSGDTGVAVWGVRAESNITPTDTAGDYSFLAVDSHGSQFVVPGRASTANLANVSSSASTGTVLASNVARKGVIIHNDSTATLFLKYGATASATSYTYKIPPDATWEMPSPLFAGVLDGIWSAANGAARVTELTG